MAPELEPIFNGVKSHSKYYNGYVYLIIEIDNPLVDSIIHFFNKVTRN